VVAGNILALPFRDDAVPSLSCLHVAEHVGLGRYGDPLNPAGTRDAARELSRILAPGGSLYLSVPVGRSRVEFNAHRIHTPAQVIEMFPELELQSFSAEDDAGEYIEDTDPAALSNASYACGMFWFRKPERRS
jgi:predicted SAM-dependent methyltransferase